MSGMDGFAFLVSVVVVADVNDALGESFAAAYEQANGDEKMEDGQVRRDNVAEDAPMEQRPSGDDDGIHYSLHTQIQVRCAYGVHVGNADHGVPSPVVLQSRALMCHSRTVIGFVDPLEVGRPFSWL